MKTLRFLFVFVFLLPSQLHAADFSFAGFNLPGAPLAGSAEDQADYQQLLDLQNTRTEADCARAASEVAITLTTFFGAPYGPLTANEISRMESPIARYKLQALATIGSAKSQWQRPRPFKAHADIKPCIKLEPSFSYPSGHSALAEFYARMLEVAYPAKTVALEARAKEIARDRTVGGVHYPTDVRDGNLLGNQIYENLNPNGALDRHIQNAIRAFDVVSE